MKINNYNQVNDKEKKSAREENILKIYLKLWKKEKKN